MNKILYADMAQLAEQLICNQQVIGAIPIVGSHGWIPEWPKGADCKSVVDDFEGSNPSPSMHGEVMILVEYRGVEQFGSSSGS